MTGRIVASLLTDRDIDDASQVGPLLDQIAEPAEVFMCIPTKSATDSNRKPATVPT